MYLFFWSGSLPGSAEAQLWDPLQTNLTAFPTDLTGFQTDLTGFQTDLTGFQTDLTGFQTDLTGFQTDLTGFQTDLTGFQTDLTGFQTDLTGFQTSLASRQTSLASRQTSLASRPHCLPDRPHCLPDRPHCLPDRPHWLADENNQPAGTGSHTYFSSNSLLVLNCPPSRGAEPYKKRVRLTSCVEDLRPPADPDHRPCLHRPLLDSSLSRSLFHCYINEEQAQEGSRPRAGARVVGAPRGGLVQGPGRGRSGSPEEGVVVGMEVGVSRALQGAAMLGGNRTDHREAMSLSHFNIPNVVNSEHCSALGADDLLLGEPPIIMAGECHWSHSAHHMMD
eukprot:XP_014056694.1 PREDICTED: uncharacterized protein LOC106605495 [Salmo salar]